MCNKLPPGGGVNRRGLNTANSLELHSSILKSLLVNHVTLCQPVVKAWFQCVFLLFLGLDLAHFHTSGVTLFLWDRTMYTLYLSCKKIPFTASFQCRFSHIFSTHVCAWWWTMARDSLTEKGLITATKWFQQWWGVWFRWKRSFLREWH